jgi:hypothetical protein
MKRVFNFKNGTIHVLNLDKFDNEKFRKNTEIFLTKVIKERIQNGNRYKS